MRLRGCGEACYQGARRVPQVSQVRARVRGTGGDARDHSTVNATVVGGGLAGCEAAWALAKRGVAVTRRVPAHPHITVVREEATELPSPAVIATGPLTSDAMARVIAERLGAASLAFYDAIAPIVSADSLELDRLY